MGAGHCWASGEWGIERGGILAGKGEVERKGPFYARRISWGDTACDQEAWARTVVCLGGVPHRARCVPIKGASLHKSYSVNIGHFRTWYIVSGYRTHLCLTVSFDIIISCVN